PPCSTPSRTRAAALAEVWRRFTRNRLATAGAAGVLILVTLAVFAPWVAPRDPLYIDMDHKFARPGQAGFVLGADELGRDVLSRLLHAGRVSLAVGLITALIAVVVGAVLGALAGYYGGALDAVIMRLVDVLLSMPTTFLLESSLSYLGYGIQPPTASWGNMLNNAQSYVLYAPWVAVYPGAMISLTVLSFNFAGDGLRDALDPRLCPCPTASRSNDMNVSRST